MEWWRLQEPTRRQAWKEAEETIVMVRKAREEWLAKGRLPGWEGMARMLELAFKLKQFATGMASEVKEVQTNVTGTLEVEWEIALRKAYGPKEEAKVIDVEALPKTGRTDVAGEAEGARHVALGRRLQGIGRVGAEPRRVEPFGLAQHLPDEFPGDGVLAVDLVAEAPGKDAGMVALAADHLAELGQPVRGDRLELARVLAVESGSSAARDLEFNAARAGLSISVHHADTPIAQNKASNPNTITRDSPGRCCGSSIWALIAATPIENEMMTSQGLAATLLAMMARRRKTPNMEARPETTLVPRISRRAAPSSSGATSHLPAIGEAKPFVADLLPTTFVAPCFG